MNSGVSFCIRGIPRISCIHCVKTAWRLCVTDDSLESSSSMFESSSWSSTWWPTDRNVVLSHAALFPEWGQESKHLCCHFQTSRSALFPPGGSYRYLLPNWARPAVTGRWWSSPVRAQVMTGQQRSCNVGRWIRDPFNFCRPLFLGGGMS